MATGSPPNPHPAHLSAYRPSRDPRHSCQWSPRRSRNNPSGHGQHRSGLTKKWSDCFDTPVDGRLSKPSVSRKQKQHQDQGYIVPKFGISWEIRTASDLIGNWQCVHHVQEFKHPAILGCFSSGHRKTGQGTPGKQDGMSRAKKAVGRKKPERNYTPRTLKRLFALSGNRCAYPECTNPIIVTSTGHSDDHVLGQVSHIYALRENGPRGKAGLTERELNEPENLILLCPTHHSVVDGQHETYPADLLKEWKNRQEKRTRSEISSAGIERSQRKVFPRFPVALVDQKIEHEVSVLRKSRPFTEFDKTGVSLSLAARLEEGDLSAGTDAVRSRAQAWCARFLSNTEHLEKAGEILERAKNLGFGPEIDIADAFILDKKGDKAVALRILAEIDVPMARSAALMVVANHDGSQAGLDWLSAAGIEARELDPEGKDVLLGHLLQLGQCEAAKDTLDAVADSDLQEAPTLHQKIAMTNLLSTVPKEFRGVVLSQLPLQAAQFPLASDSAAIDARRTARRHFVSMAEAARQLDCPGAASSSDEYALWLELMDPDESHSGRQRLETKLRGTKPALRVVSLGLQFGVKLDLEAIEQEIQRQIALHGGMTLDAALARLALAFTQKTPEQAAGYIATHRSELVKYLDVKSIGFLEIELLSRAGRPERAVERLGALQEQGLATFEEGRLQRIIAEAEGTDPIEARKEQFEQTDSLSDLESLVTELEQRQDWDELRKYAEALFQRTRSLPNAERLATALANTNQTELAVKFLTENASLLRQSKNLQMLFCWSLFHEGDLLKARDELSKLKDTQKDPNYRALRVNLGICLGDWNSLSAYLADECREKEDRSPEELIGAARLALNLGSSHAKELLFSAATNAGDDAAVLAAAHFLACSGGWDEEPEVHQWLHRAAELSGDDGPVQKISLEELLDLKPDWDRRESETWRLYSCGDVPMYLAAQAMNKSLADLILLPALANQSETDPRRRGVVPAYSGQRQSGPLNFGGTVGMDPTALLTLSLLNLLDAALDAFGEIRLPHSTLTWLLHEKQRASFHQPSRVKEAHRLRSLLAGNMLETLTSGTVPDSELAAQVGDELALLITEAELRRNTGDSQHIVVQPAPVHRVASLIQEEADVSAHASVLSSCHAIVEKLRQRGQVTAAEERKGRNYLLLQEEPWPNQPKIADGAILYLSSLATTYFLAIGMLEKLKAAGFRAIISPEKVDESNELISYEHILGQVSDAIEKVRVAVNSRIESGKIKIERQSKIEKDQAQSNSIYPAGEVIALAKNCDLIVSDDRFFNQHSNVAHDGSQAMTCCTLDLLDTLFSSGTEFSRDRSEHITLLRRGGYFLVPVSEDELSDLLDASEVRQGGLVETAELKAIRENILCVRMGHWLQLPKEAPWLIALLSTFVKVLKKQWGSEADVASARARSDWLLDQIDVRGWAHRLGTEGGNNLIRNEHALHIMPLLSPPDDVSKETGDQYWDWIEERLLVPIKEEDPELYLRIVELQKEKIAYFANAEPEQANGE